MKYTKKDAIGLIKMLRYKNHAPKKTSRTYMPVIKIAKFLNKSSSYVQKICESLIKN